MDIGVAKALGDKVHRTRLGQSKKVVPNSLPRQPARTAIPSGGKTTMASPPAQVRQ